MKRLRKEQEREKKSFRENLLRSLFEKYDTIILDEILIPNRNSVVLDPEEVYKQITVKMQHKGVIQRGVVKGSEVGSTQFLAKENDFIISKIDARNGAMGLVPAELDNAIVTNDFPLFNFSEDCLPKYFNFVANTAYFDQKCVAASEGTTNRVRLKMDRFKLIEIPFPPIEEQSRIVMLLEKFSQAAQLQAAQLAELDALLPSVLDKAFKGEF